MFQFWPSKVTLTLQSGIIGLVEVNILTQFEQNVDKYNYQVLISSLDWSNVEDLKGLLVLCSQHFHAGVLVLAVEIPPVAFQDDYVVFELHNFLTYIFVQCLLFPKTHKIIFE
jgi:hypothetical protein